MSVDLRRKKIAIIGGAGFIGHNLALALAERGAEVEIIDSLQVNNLLSFASSADPNREFYMRIINERLTLLNRSGIPLHPLDARDYHVLSRMLGHQIKPQVIVHLAAVAHAGRSNKDPFSTFDHSLRTLENALDCARDNVEQFIFLSSSMVYGHFATDAVDEDHPLNPLGIYGALKVAGEKMVIAYEQVFNLPYTIVRPSALYGPRCVSRRVGQMFIEAARSGSLLRIDGDGNDRLDFTYIDDLIQGVILAIGHPAARNEIFNITYGQSRSIADLLRIVRQHFPDVTVERVERDSLMPERGTLNVGKARSLLGYAPRFDLETGMAQYVGWYASMDAGAVAAG